MKTLDLGTDHVAATVEDGLATITLNRPEKLNALSLGMTDGLARALSLIELDDEVGCVLLTGAGRAFCAGGDIDSMDSMASGTPSRSIETRIHMLRLKQRATVQHLFELPKPTIAAINGAAAGGGLAIALACDIRYCSTSAVLTTAYARIGLSGDYGATWFLTQLVGTAKARELLYFADRIDPIEAERVGIVNAVFETGNFEEEVHSRASRLAHGPSVGYRYMKQNLNRAVTGTLADCLDLEAENLHRALLTEDHRDAVKAFLEKRTPTYNKR